MEVETSGQNSISLLETWRHHASLGCHDDCSMSALDLATSDPAKVPRCPSADPLLEELLLNQRRFKSNRHTTHHPRCKPPPPKSVLQTLIHLPRPTATSKFTFSIPDDRIEPLTISLKALPLKPTQGIKRRRCILDVDGFNTAGLSSKKRRLRVELITSRLSQPYSQPATHILNREGQESGDKRFLKMATTLDSSRRATHLHATSFLRFSTMNRLRKRLNLTHPGAFARRDDQEAVAVVAKANACAKAAWRPQTIQASSAGKSLMLSPLPSGAMSIMPTVPQPPPVRIPITPQKHVAPHAKPPACRLSTPAALPLPATDIVAAAKKRTSPRIHPVQSPELRPSSPLPHLDDLEEDSFAFLHLPEDDYDDMGGDDQESVYSDFSVVFGQEAPGAEANDERTYEEYLDELDGICWVSR